jgi:hypothetical protein
MAGFCRRPLWVQDAAAAGSATAAAPAERDRARSLRRAGGRARAAGTAGAGSPPSTVGQRLWRRRHGACPHRPAASHHRRRETTGPIRASSTPCCSTPLSSTGTFRRNPDVLWTLPADRPHAGIGPACWTPPRGGKTGRRDLRLLGDEEGGAQARAFLERLRVRHLAAPGEAARRAVPDQGRLAPPAQLGREAGWALSGRPPAGAFTGPAPASRAGSRRTASPGVSPPRHQCPRSWRRTCNWEGGRAVRPAGPTGCAST